jgi:hypothetical protein
MIPTSKNCKKFLQIETNLEEKAPIRHGRIREGGKGK